MRLVRRSDEARGRRCAHERAAPRAAAPRAGRTCSLRRHVFRVARRGRAALLLPGVAAPAFVGRRIDGRRRPLEPRTRRARQPRRRRARRRRRRCAAPCGRTRRQRSRRGADGRRRLHVCRWRCGGAGRAKCGRDAVAAPSCMCSRVWRPESALHGDRRAARVPQRFNGSINGHPGIGKPRGECGDGNCCADAFYARDTRARRGTAGESRDGGCKRKVASCKRAVACFAASSCPAGQLVPILRRLARLAAHQRGHRRRAGAVASNLRGDEAAAGVARSASGLC